MHSRSCGYDVVVFDDTSHPPQILHHAAGTICLYHSSLRERNPGLLAGYLDMKIMRDGALGLASFLDYVRARRGGLLWDCARNCLVEAVLCAHRSLESRGDAASCWQKCATTYLADAILALHSHTSSSHALGLLRGMRDGPGFDVIPTVVESLGVERASAILLRRMMLSAQGLSEMAETHPYMVRYRADALLRDSRFADCYWYLCRTSRDCWTRLRGDAAAESAARIAFDADRDYASTIKRASCMRQAADHILGQMAAKPDL